MLEWFAPALVEMARMAAASSSSSESSMCAPVSLHMSVYVTCLCDPGAVPEIPNCDVMMVRPDVYRILDDLVSPCRDGDERDDGGAKGRELEVSKEVMAPEVSAAGGGGVGVCASGPASLVREASNAVARLGLTRRAMEMGGIDIHTEVFSL